MALNDKQQAFVEAYLATWNASEAARRADYAKPGQQGHRLLKNVEIEAEVKRRIADKAMTADEVLTRLAHQARGDLTDFVRFDDNGNPTFDLQTAATNGKLVLAKKLKTKTRQWSEQFYNHETDEFNSRPVSEVTIEFELYDAQAALVHIGKHHALFVDKVELGGELLLVNVDK